MRAYKTKKVDPLRNPRAMDVSLWTQLPRCGPGSKGTKTDITPERCDDGKKVASKASADRVEQSAYAKFAGDVATTLADIESVIKDAQEAIDRVSAVEAVGGYAMAVHEALKREKALQESVSTQEAHLSAKLEERATLQDTLNSALDKQKGMNEIFKAGLKDDDYVQLRDELKDLREKSLSSAQQLDALKDQADEARKTQEKARQLFEQKREKARQLNKDAVTLQEQILATEASLNEMQDALALLQADDSTDNYTAIKAKEAEIERTSTQLNSLKESLNAASAQRAEAALEEERKKIELAAAEAAEQRAQQDATQLENERNSARRTKNLFTICTVLIILVGAGLVYWAENRERRASWEDLIESDDDEKVEQQMDALDDIFAKKMGD